MPLFVGQGRIFQLLLQVSQFQFNRYDLFFEIAQPPISETRVTKEVQGHVITTFLVVVHCVLPFWSLGSCANGGYSSPFSFLHSLGDRGGLKPCPKRRQRLSGRLPWSSRKGLSRTLLC